jgi:hypothetical protein
LGLADAAILLFIALVPLLTADFAIGFEPVRVFLTACTIRGSAPRPGGDDALLERLAIVLIQFLLNKLEHTLPYMSGYAALTTDLYGKGCG